MVLAALISFNLASSRVLFYQLLYALTWRSLTATVCTKRVPNCHAHCFLEKQINAAENQSETSPSPPPMPSRLQSLPAIDLFLPARPNWTIYNLTLQTLPPFKFEVNTDFFPPEVFHPPEA